MSLPSLSRRSLLGAAGALVLSSRRVYAASSLLEILKVELERNFSALKTKGDPPPYFMAYAVTEQQRLLIIAGGGAIRAMNDSRGRGLDTTVRVGKPQLDNYHPVRGDIGHFTAFSQISLEDDANQINRALWSESDRVYRLASQRLAQLMTQQQLIAEQKDMAPDFSSETPTQAVVTVKTIQPDAEAWKKKLRQWSGEFQSHPKILNSGVNFAGQREVRSFVNSEGTSVSHGGTFFRLDVSASTVAEDGMALACFDAVEAFEEKNLPGDKAMRAAVKKVAEQVDGLLAAPPAEPFVGPAILSGRASAVFFHEIFGHRVEGHRQKDMADGQTFGKMLNERVLPEFISVTFDPTRRDMNGRDLIGFYEYDDEGVKARAVKVVEAGILKTFLMSRSPTVQFAKSNGHGRRQAGFEVVSRQSNLLVESSKQVTQDELRKQLMAEIKRQQKPYGLYFEQVSSGYTTTGREGLQAFTVVPLVVYRVYADGRPDELIRGVDIVGTPLASFQKILATSNQAEVFNGFCGAESGSVPVSAVSPAILVSEIEVQRKPNSQQRQPVLPRPPARESNS